MELLAAVGRDLGVVGRVAEAGRAAGVDVPVAVDLDQRLGLVALRIGGDRGREGEPLGIRRTASDALGPLRRLDGQRAVVVLRSELTKPQASAWYVAGREVVGDDRLAGRAGAVARADFARRRSPGSLPSGPLTVSTSSFTSSAPVGFDGVHAIWNLKTARTSRSPCAESSRRRRRLSEPTPALLQSLVGWALTAGIVPSQATVNRLSSLAGTVTLCVGRCRSTDVQRSDGDRRDEQR